MSYFSVIISLSLNESQLEAILVRTPLALGNLHPEAGPAVPLLSCHRLMCQTVSGWRKQEVNVFQKKYNGNAFFCDSRGCAARKGVGRHPWGKSPQLHCSLWWDGGNGRSGPALLQMRNCRNPGHALSPVFILKCDPAKIGPSTPSSNIFNFHFVLLCATLQAELKTVTWSDTYAVQNFIHFTSSFHFMKKPPDKTALMENKAIPKTKKSDWTVRTG